MLNMPENIDAAIITGDTNRRYYTGFKSSAGTLLVTREKCYFIIDFRYYEAAKQQVKDCEVILQSRLFDQLNGLIEKHKIKNIGVETGYLTISEYLRFKNCLKCEGLLMDEQLNDFIANQRRVKTQDEIDSIIKAQIITDKTFDYILNFIKPGRTEKEIALEMEYYSRKIGSENASFDFIVVSGANSSLPHGVPTEKPVNSGDFITMDFGAIVDGYHSDMTRTVAVGSVSDKQREVYNIVLKAQLAALAKIKAGEYCVNIDKAARDIISEAGYGGCFGHGLGHGVGLEIHEEPRFNSAYFVPCQCGEVVTVEPGIYIEGEFGVRIEDMIIVNNTGCTNITKSKKELIIL